MHKNVTENENSNLFIQSVLIVSNQKQKL